ncbi:condensation domain-containing protein [Pseudomonas aeruginosa]|nr:condensation domain-containing protein [Pseudomonas aeruginosa]
MQLSPRDLFQHQSIRSLALAAKAGAATAEQGPASGEVALAPVQRWFFEQSIPNRQHWNQSLCCRRASRSTATGWGVPWNACRRSTMPCACVSAKSAAPGTRPTPSRPASRCGAGRRVRGGVAGACEEAQRSLDLEQGPLLRALLVDMADGSQRLLLVIHHLAVDGVSWRILLEDLQRLYADLDADLGRVAVPTRPGAGTCTNRPARAWTNSTTGRRNCTTLRMRCHAKPARSPGKPP